MPASSGGGSSPAPRAMKRELAFALQSLSEITASPGRTRSGRPISSSGAGGAKRRRTRSEEEPLKDDDQDKPHKDPTDLVSPPTPPLDAEAPKTNHHAGLMDSADPPPTKEGDGSNPPQLCVGSNVALAKADGDGDVITQPSQSDGEAAKQDDAGMGLDADALTKPDVLTTGGCAAGLDGRPTFLQESTAVIGDQNGKLTDVCNVFADPPLVAEDSATPASTANLKPTRRFTRSLLKNKPEEEATTSESQGPVAVSLTSEDKKDAAVGSALPTEKPERRFTRSLLKAKVPGGGLVGSEEPIDSTSHSPPSVKKMEMKMSKKVACLTKHPGNIRELLNTGLLEGMPVMYIIPHSKRTVLKGVITGCNIRCFCCTCNGSKAVCAYFFEQHAGSNKRHPADYIYLGNGNNLRDVLRASDSSPLESLEKTIRSSIDPMVKRSRNNCLNCNEHLPSTQAEHFLCDCCLESKEPQDSPSPCHAYKNGSSLTRSKDSLLKKISSSKKGGSAGKVTTKDTGLHKLVFKVLLDGTEVAYYVDGKRKVDGYIKDQRIYCNHCNRVVSPSAFEAHAGEGTRRKPYDNIFTSNGVSLHELSMKISKDMELSERETDELCGECGQGGDIFPCKICPRSFHPGRISNLPEINCSIDSL